ncbi:class I SAM-dependent methyltransferase [Nocardioides speluncae]|uniref:class I SAM-dependent methyltransferase n=1 Tax=Nocardioides speluncae TaxID=2670337 RepID=UPI00137A73EE|nr:methyltransferase domain-containing protein [Nocardioides speluncae]
MSSDSAELDNAGMVQVWDGQVGRDWVAEQDRYARMNAGFTEMLLAAAAVQPGERVLEVGCGFGAVAYRLGELAGPAGEVVGVDVSGPMLEVAAERAADLAQVSFRHDDAQEGDLGEASYALAVSQFGVMFFADPAKAIGNIVSALRPGGRLAFTCWQDMSLQPRIVVPAAAALTHIPVPEMDQDFWGLKAFSLADPQAIEDLLGHAGLADIRIEPATSPEYLGSDVADTVEFMRRTEFGQLLFADVDNQTAERGWDAVATALTDHQTSDGVYLDGAAWLVTARREPA